MCEGCGCHTAWKKPKRAGTGKDVAPGQWHVHADGTAHRHEHAHAYRPVADTPGSGPEHGPTANGNKRAEG